MQIWTKMVHAITTCNPILKINQILNLEGVNHFPPKKDWNHNKKSQEAILKILNFAKLWVL
jgi:hypothetical protein